MSSAGDLNAQSCPISGQKNSLLTFQCQSRFTPSVERLSMLLSCQFELRPKDDFQPVIEEVRNVMECICIVCRTPRVHS